MLNVKAAIVRVHAIAVLAVALAAYGCNGGQRTLKEVQRVKAGNLNVILLSERESLQHGPDAFYIEFRSASGDMPVDVGAVRGSATMPMPGSSPMFATVNVTRTDTPGRYQAKSQFDMAGTWRATLEWDGPSGKSSVAFSGAVQ